MFVTTWSGHCLAISSGVRGTSRRWLKAESPVGAAVGHAEHLSRLMSKPFQRTTQRRAQRARRVEHGGRFAPPVCSMMSSGCGGGSWCGMARSSWPQLFYSALSLPLWPVRVWSKIWLPSRARGAGLDTFAPRRPETISRIQVFGIDRPASLTGKAGVWLNPPSAL